MNWIIEKLETQLIDGSLTDVVITAYWRCSTVLDGFYGTVWGSKNLTPANPYDFTPYNELTQEQVLGWLWDDGVNKEPVEKQVLAQIDLQKKPPVTVLPNPWL